MSAAHAARDHGYATDYIARRCREGAIRSILIGRAWYLDPQSLEAFLVAARRNDQQRRQQLIALRNKEQQRGVIISAPNHPAQTTRP